MKVRKKEMTKSIITIILISTMLLTLFAGCQSDNGATSKETTDDPKTTASNEKENFNPVGYPIVDEEITVTSMISELPMYLPDDPKDVDTDVLYWKELRKLTNIKVDWEYVEADDTVLNLYFAAGDLPDFFVKSLTPERINEYGIKGGMFLDISDMIYEYMPHLVKTFEKWPDMKKSIVELDGKIYGIPMFRGGTTSTGGIMHYRTDYFEKLGLKVPTTIDEFYDTCVKIKDSGLTEGYAPFCPYYPTLGLSEDFFFPAFGEAYQSGFADDGAGKVVYNKTSDQYRRYLEYLNKLYKAGLMENEYLSLDSNTIQSRVKAGQIVFTGVYSNLLPEDFLDGKMGIGCLAPLVSEYTSAQKILGYSHISVAAGGINKNSKNPEAILRMLDIAYAKDEVVAGTGLDGEALNTGIKGITYEIDEATSTKIYLVPDDKKDMPFYSWLRKYHGWNAHYGVIDNMYFSDDVNAGARERSREASIRPYEKPRLYDNLFKYTEDEKDVMATKMADIDKYVTEMVAKFITGVEPLTNWDNYVSTISKMGIDEILKIKQNGYDRWNK